MYNSKNKCDICYRCFPPRQFPPQQQAEDYQQSNGYIPTSNGNGYLPHQQEYHPINTTSPHQAGNFHEIPTYTPMHTNIPENHIDSKVIMITVKV